MKRFLRDCELEHSTVVANCRMNRERELSGSNGYDRELGVQPLDFLRERIRPGRVIRWLDLCCGTARALFQAAEQMEHAGLTASVAITGVDLVDMFWPGRPPTCLDLVVASIHAFEPVERFDLITCVHGLHYLGDKLKVIERAMTWLVEDGLFVANLDLANLRHDDGRPLARRIGKLFREAGIDFDGRRKRLVCRGRRVVRFPLAYLGADDTAGPNSTGQAAVSSYYRDQDCTRRGD
jgi:SAM-dependent methyltransferase